MTVLLIIVSLLGPTTDPAQLIDRAIDATGAQAFADSRYLLFEYEGRALWEGQGISPARPVRIRTFERQTVLDEEGGRFARDQRTWYDDGTPSSCSRFVAGASGGVLYDCLAGSVRNAPGGTGAQLSAFWKQSRLHAMLIDARTRPEGLRWLGQRQLAGRTVDLVSSEMPSGERRTWYIDAGSHLPVMLEWAVDDPLIGNVARRIEWDDYRNVGSFRFPHRITRLVRAGTSYEERYDTVSATEKVGESMFEVPDTALNWQDFGVEQPLSLDWLAERVLLVKNISSGYNTLFVHTSEGLLVMDAPGPAETGEKMLEIARTEFPDTELRFVVPTHFHWDHVGALPELVRTGADVVTTPDTRTFIREFAFKKTNSAGDRDRIRSVGNAQTIGKGANRVELIRVDADPHVESMLIAYLPEDDILYVTDLFQKETGGHIAPARPETIRFLEVLKELDVDVEIIAPAHGEQATMDDLREAVDMVRAEAN